MKVGITGSSGFIGSELAKLYPGYSRYPKKDLYVLFHFASPSSETIFKENMDYCFRETINSFIDMVSFCKTNDIKLIYPSSATVYNKATAYARCKACCEEIHQAYGGDILGLRIFAGYGPGEKNKTGYSSVVYEFCKTMKNGERPVIWGDGTQTRDFVYIDDIVNTIYRHSTSIGMLDIGTGINTSFNELVEIINKELKTNIEPIYVEKPGNYISETPCSKPIDNPITLEKGVHLICQTL